MDQLRAWYGERYSEQMEQVRRFWDGEGRCLVSVHSTAYDYAKIDDEQEVRARVIPQLRAEAYLPGINLPSVYANWGTVSTAKYWGGAIERHNDFIHIAPVAQTLDEALVLEPLPVDDPTMDASRALARYRWAVEQLQTDILWMRSPDLQGTLNTAGLVLNQSVLFMAMCTDPQSVHTFLTKVCAHLIAFSQYLRRETDGRISGNIWPHTFFPASVGVGFTEDVMPMLSTDMYQEFGLPYLRQFQSALGGLHIHCCGRWGHHARSLAESGLMIKAVEFHYPFTRIEQLAPLVENTVFIPYIFLDKQDDFRTVSDYYRYLIDCTDPAYRYWFACAEDTPELLAFAREVGRS